MFINGKTVYFDHPPVITGSAGVAGKKEGEGPLSADFDEIFEDTTMGQESFELAESAILHAAVLKALSNAKKSPEEVNFALLGDLLDQCVGSCFAMKDLQIPFIGMYGACSTMALTLAQAAVLVDAGADCCVAGASSHFCSSERQFRFPLEYGGQRPPTSQWTVTGAGAAVVESETEENRRDSVKIKSVEIGTITDLGVRDAGNMGAAMAPAAARTISEFLKDSGTDANDYDLVLTGDLGATGSELLHQVLKIEYDLDIKKVHNDCGLMIFDRKKQDVNSGGSGCGCSASVLCSHIIKRIKKGELNNVLFVATGALMSPTSTKQGRPIPGIAHAVLLER